MAITAIPISRGCSVVLDLGDEKTKSVSIVGSKKMKVNAPDANCYGLATAVAGLYTGTLLRVQTTDRKELQDS